MEKGNLSVNSDGGRERRGMQVIHTYVCMHIVKGAENRKLHRQEGVSYEYNYIHNYERLGVT